MSQNEEPFEKILEKLEKVVQDLEEGGLPLEKALERFEQGVALSRKGAKRLDEAERKIEEILEDGSTKVIEADPDKDKD